MINLINEIKAVEHFIGKGFKFSPIRIDNGFDIEFEFNVGVTYGRIDIMKDCIRQLQDNKINHTVSKKYERGGIKTSIIVQDIDIYNYIKLDSIKNLILINERYFFGKMKLNNNVEISGCLFFTMLYLNILKKGSSELVYNKEHDMTNINIEHHIRNCGDVYKTYDAYYRKYRGEFLWNENHDYVENISEEEITEEIFYNILNIAAFHI